MSNYLDPIDAANKPRENLIRYLLTSYPLRDLHLRYGFKQLLEQPGNIYQYPYLEGTQPYKTGTDIQQLVAQGILHPQLTRMFDPTRLLYSHQQEAIQAVVERKENIIVATGTGSGKTECFLIPMLDYLLKHPKTGLQALILYPMNALVNDQVKRLRQLLCRQSGEKPIRFGFYTSRTEIEPKAAKQALKQELEASDRQELLQLLPGGKQESRDLISEVAEQVMQLQAISRQEIWEEPPQILVTNYSMLEHMLIRPQERNKIFGSSRHFRLLIVDEAHSYGGSMGTEVSMLIKRFKSALGIEETGKIQVIATSATLGDRHNTSVNTQVINFAQDLFSEPFHRVIWGDRSFAGDRLGSPYELPQGLPESEVYEHFYNLQLPSLKDPIENWYKQLSCLAPHPVLENALQQAQGNIHRFLWFAFRQHPTIHRLMRCLEKGPLPWYQLARSPQLWEIPQTLNRTIPPSEDAKLETALSHLVQLGTLARQHPQELPLVPVRLHLLFRSIEGIYACINPQCPEAPRHPQVSDRPLRYGKLFLTSKTSCDCCGAPVVELASCRKCGQAYGLIYLKDNKQLQLLPYSLEAVENSNSIYILTSGPLDSITDDEGDDSELEDDTKQSTTTRTGTFIIYKENDIWKGETTSGESSADWILHWYSPANKQSGYLNQCPACGARRSHTSPISRFVSYTDAPLEVMIDSLFELLPEPELPTTQYTKRKILTFSDGRQDAAFFASDFQRTHTETLYRQLVWQAFSETQKNNTASVNQVQKKLVEKFLEISIPHPDRDPEKHHRSYVPKDANEETRSNEKDCEINAESRAKELLLREFGLPSARRFSIEALGLIACHLESFNSDFLARVTEKFGTSAKENYAEARIFLTGLTDIVRLKGAIDLEGSSRYFPETGGVGEQPPRLNNKGRSQIYLKLRRDPNEKQALSFLWRKNAKGEPTPNQNQIVTYYRNFLKQFPPEESLMWLFDELLKEKILVKYSDGRQLRWELFNLELTTTDWYQCNICQQIFHIPGLANILRKSRLGVDHCLAYKCDGKLQPLNCDDYFAEHHYRHLIQKRSILPLRAQEHTAQLSVEELAKRENRFRQGKINLLSCSTTLEMGVDIGELQVVVLRNFPPHVSNYQQRAGRAGRRTDGVAVILMYGQRRPHDRCYFEQPARLIAGTNRAPKLDPANFEIQKRHIRAELLAEFLRTSENKGAEQVSLGEFLGLEKFKEVSEIGTSSISFQLREWLHQQQAKTYTRQWLRRLGSQKFPDCVLEEFVEDLQRFEKEQLQDWNHLCEVLKELKIKIREADDAGESKKRNKLNSRHNHIEDELEKILKRQLHEELAKASILPIYGFPIDVVQLLTSNSEGYSQRQGKHRLQRDRRLALGEYAPGQEVVVDDRVHTSAGILNPDRLSSQYYWVCQSCNYFMAGITKEELENRLTANGYSKCPFCHKKPHPQQKEPKLYKIPRAFITDWNEKPKVTSYNKPVHQPTSQVFLVQEGEKIESEKTEFFELTISQGGKFFLSNQGPLEQGRGFKNRGFAICEKCGRDLSNQTGNQKHENKSHIHPLTGSNCSGSYKRIHLGHEFKSDLLKIRFTSAVNPPSLFNLYTDTLEEAADNLSNKAVFWRSLSQALLAAAAQIIDLPRSEIDALFRPLEENKTKTAEIIIYDNVPGGAGLSKRIAESFGEILQQAYQLVKSCSCSSSCYDCLKTYTNQHFHDQLDRHQVSNFLGSIVEGLQSNQKNGMQAPFL